MPYKKIKGWAWESYWLVGGLVSWLVAPWVLGYLTVPHLLDVLHQAPSSTIAWAYFWGVLWGTGGLTFGLAMRYLGLSLGMAVTLGLCAVFGTLVPPIYEGKMGELVATSSGRFILLGLGVCVLGILICGRAGLLKEKTLTTAQKQATVVEFDLRKGLLVAVFSGIMSACFSFGLTAGQPIAKLAEANGTNPLFVNNAILVVILAGGLTTKALWCIYLNIKNKTYTDYLNLTMPAGAAQRHFLRAGGHYLVFSVLLLRHGRQPNGRLPTLHMAFIIAFSSMWGLLLHEWRGANKLTLRTVQFGILAVVRSTVVVGYGNYLGSGKATIAKAEPPARAVAAE